MYKSTQKRYMYDWVPLLSTWNYHNSVNWLYGNKKQKKVNKNKSTQKCLKNSRGIISQQHSWCVLFYLSPTHFLLLNYLQVPTYYFILKYFSSVQFSHPVMSDFLRPDESQHTRPPCPSRTPRIYSNSCPSSWWCYPTISSSVILFSSCPQSLPASGSFPMNQLFAWGGQSTGVSASASTLPMNTQDWSPLGWTGWISLQSKGLSSLLQHHSSKASILWCSAFFTVQLSHPHMTTGKTIALTRRTFVGRVMSLLFNMLSRLVISFLPRSKRLLISWLQSPSAVILEPI